MTATGTTAKGPPAAPAHRPDLPAGRPAVADLPPFTGRQLGALLLITLLAALLRLHGLHQWSMWVDEAHTWRDVTNSLADFRASPRGWYPLSFLGLRWLLETGLLPNFSEGWLRLPFAFCGIVSVPLLALFGQPLVGRRAALLAALFLAINPWHIYWSQNARGYVLVFFFAVIAAGVWWHGMHRRSRPWMAVALLAAAAAGGCHFTGFILFPVFLAHAVLARDALTRRARWMTLGVAVAALVVLPHVLPVLPPFRSFMRAKPDASLLHMVQTTAYYFRLPLLLAALLGLWLLLRRGVEQRALFLACWTIVPILVLAVVGFSVVKVTARYALCALPAVLLLAGATSVRVGEVLTAGLDPRGAPGAPGRLGRRTRWLPAALLPGILCADMAAYDYLYYTVQHGDRGRYREAAEVVMRRAGERRAAVLTVNEPSMQYYLLPNHWRQQVPDDPDSGTKVLSINSWDVDPPPDPAQPWTLDHDGADYLEGYLVQARQRDWRLFVVVTLPELAEKDPDGTLRAAIRERLDLVGVLPCWIGPKDETVYVYESRER